MEIIPAIIPKNFEDLIAHVAEVKDLVKHFHIDVLDGEFVKNKSWPYSIPNDKDFFDIVTERKGWPFWEDISYSVDMMVSEPEKKIENWIASGVERITVHLESTNNMDSLVNYFRQRFPRETQNLADPELGVAINISTPISEIEKYADRIDFVQCMSIDEIGAQGHPFDERVYDKIREIRERFPFLSITVDGGVSLSNAERLIKSGANNLIVGSGIFGQNDKRKAVEDFKSISLI